MSSCHLICRRYGNIGKLWLSFAINKHHLAFLNLKKKLKNAYIYLKGGSALDLAIYYCFQSQ